VSYPIVIGHRIRYAQQSELHYQRVGNAIDQ
jgi:hypothetical protein